MLQVRLLGQFDLRADGKRVVLPTRAAQSLFAFLILTAGTAHRREKLAGQFWPETLDENARGYLRRELWRIRKALSSPHVSPSEYLLAEELTIAFSPQSDYWLDVAQLERDLTPQDSPEVRINQVSVYQGELLPGFYEDWVVLERQRLQALFEDRMQQLLECLVAEKRWTTVLEWGEKWLALGATPEPAYRALMLAHAARGDMSKVAALYQRCVEGLRDDLGVEPSVETRALYEGLVQGVQAPKQTVSIQPSEREILQALPLKESLALSEAPTPSEPIFVGRERELTRLQTFLDHALAGNGQVAFVVGEAGSGKSALVTTFASRMQDAHPHLIVASGTCNALGGRGDPYLPFREVLGLLTGVSEARLPRDNERLRTIAECSAELMVEVGPNLIGTFVPGMSLVSSLGNFVTQKAGWMAELEKMAQRKPSDNASTKVEQDRIFEQYANVLKKLAREKPLLLIIDDLHWADEASVGLLFHLSRRLETSRVFILGTYRGEEVQGQGAEQSRLEKLLAEIKRYAGDVWVDLGATGPAEGRAFVNQLIDSEPNRLDARFREALYQHTDGHPLFTIELLRMLEERGDLVHDATGRWVEARALDWETLPARVEGVIEERLGRLEGGQRELLRVASVEGVQFIAEVVASLQQLELRLALKELSQNLDRRHRLVREMGEVKLGKQRLAAFQFAHALFQQYLYGELGAGERRLLHGEVGRTLEQLYAGQTDEICAQLAWHYDQAGKDDKAVEYLLKAGERATSQGGTLDARRFFDRALELLPPTDHERRWRALLGREDVLELLGEIAAWHADNAALIALAEEMDDPARMAEAYYREAYLTVWSVKQSPAVLPWAEKALASAQRAGNVNFQIKARALQIRFRTESFDPERARAPMEQLFSQAQELGDDETLQRVIIGLVKVCMESHDLERAVELNQQAIAIARRRGNRYSERERLGCLGGCYADLGLYQQARATLEQKLDIDESIGYRVGRAYALLTLWSVDFWLGDGAARQRLDEVLGEFEANPLWGGRGLSLLCLSEELERSGDYASAQQQYRQLLDLWMTESLQTNVQTARAGLARCTLAMGQLDEAQKLATELWAYLQAHGAAGMSYPGWAYETCADVFAALGDEETSRAVCDAGHRDLMRLADKIHNPEWRQAFLQNVPGNRALAEMWEQFHRDG